MGSMQTLVQRCYQDCKELSEKLLERLADVAAGVQ